MSDAIFEELRKEVDSNLIPILTEYLKIPNQSRNFDPDWKTNGLSLQVCKLALDWFAKQNIEKSIVHLYNEVDQTPIVLIEIDGSIPKQILAYGHFDKQPPLSDLWRKGLGPYSPVIEGDKLYGRGSADDGFAFFEIVAIIKFLQRSKIPHPKFVLLFETDEESGSKDLPSFIQKNKKVIGKPDLVVCLDSGSMSYDHVGHVCSYRGIANFELKIEVLKNAIHSGNSGIVPDSFRIARNLIDKLENTDNGSFSIQGLSTKIPSHAYQDAEKLVIELGDKFDFKFPFLPEVQPTVKDKFQQVINGSWKSQLTSIGIDGVPSNQHSGNVLRPYTTIYFSMRLPPNLEEEKAKKSIEEFFKSQKILNDAKYSINFKTSATGFISPNLDDKIRKLLTDASKKVFGTNFLCIPCGGTVPIMNELGKEFPESNFLNTGVCQIDSAIHAPNEFISIEYFKKHICVLFDVLSKYGA